MAQQKQQAKKQPADEDCKEACKAAYVDCVKNCFRVLTDSLGTAGDDEAKRKQAKERFKKCMALCKEAKATCLETCG